MQQTCHQRFLANISIERCCFYLMCVLAATPLLFSHYPPMVDIPQHAAQVATLKSLLFSPDYPHRDLFDIHWSRPYWGGYLPLLLLSFFFTITTSVKVLVAIIIVAIPFSASRLRAHFSGDPVLDWLTLPIGYGFAFQWGFINYFAGIPVVLIFLLYVFRYAANPGMRTGLLLALFSNFLLAMHLMIAGFGSGLAIIYIFSGKSQWREKFLAILPFTSSLPYALWWLISNRIKEPGHDIASGLWNLSLWRPLEFLISATGEPFLLSSSMTTATAGILLFTLPFLLGYRLTGDRSRLYMFGALLLWMLLGPDLILGNAFTYQRFAIFGVPLFILLLRRTEKTLSPLQKSGRVLFFILPVILLAGHCFRFATFELESKGYQEISKQMPPGKHVLMLMFNSGSMAYYGPQFLHFPAWYQAEADGIVDFSFAKLTLPVQYKPGVEFPVESGFEWSPDHFNWYQHKGWLYDYFIVKDFKNNGAFLFHRTNCPIKLIANHDDWWLYANDKEHCLFK